MARHFHTGLFCVHLDAYGRLDALTASGALLWSVYTSLRQVATWQSHAGPPHISQCMPARTSPRKPIIDVQSRPDATMLVTGSPTRTFGQCLLTQLRFMHVWQYLVTYILLRGSLVQADK